MPCFMDCHAANAARNDGENFNTILRIAVGLWELCDFWGRLANLAFVPFTKIATLPHCSPKTESPTPKTESLY